MAKRQLSSHEIEILRTMENSALLRDLEHTPGWVVYRELAAAYIQSARDKYENTNMDKDATWASKIALQALKDFQRNMEETVANAKDLLEPEALKRLLESVNVPAEELEGELRYD